MASRSILSSGLTALGAVDGVFGAVRNRVDVASRAANGVARRHCERSADQADSQNFLEHCCSPYVTAETNADAQERVHSASVIFFPARWSV